MSDQFAVSSSQSPVGRNSFRRSAELNGRGHDCKFEFRQWDGLWYGWCTRLGCSNRMKPKPWKPRRVSARCRGVYGLGDVVAWLLGCFGLTKQRWRDLLVLLHLAEPGRGCGTCDRRQRWLNRLLPRLWTWLRSHHLP